MLLTSSSFKPHFSLTDVSMTTPRWNGVIRGIECNSLLRDTAFTQRNIQEDTQPHQNFLQAFIIFFKNSGLVIVMHSSSQFTDID